MKPHRVFIAINLSEEAKTKLLAYQEHWLELPAKWTSKENLHLTLAFLGNTSDQELEKVCDVVRQIGEWHKPFSVEFTKIVYGLSKDAPKMIWALIEKSPELLELQKDVMSTLHAEEEQNFIPHLTLARLRAFELSRMELEELPDVNAEISVSFEVKSIEVMESKLRRSGSEYTVIQSFMLKR
ncbi:MAG TPA: RNA 2',3'-cyclic phosphodiesterase [Candidatus Paceibacterota bacterium]